LKSVHELSSDFDINELDGRQDWLLVFMSLQEVAVTCAEAGAMTS
jgi:hypothetical protein